MLPDEPEPRSRPLRRRSRWLSRSGFPKGCDIEYYLEKLRQERERLAREAGARRAARRGQATGDQSERAGMAYYLGAVAAYGEPDGHWVREGLAELGIHDGDVIDPDVIRKIYGEFINPLDRSTPRRPATR